MFYSFIFFLNLLKDLQKKITKQKTVQIKILEISIKLGKNFKIFHLTGLKFQDFPLKWVEI